MLSKWVGRRATARRASSSTSAVAMLNRAIRAVVEPLEARQLMAATLPAGFSEALVVSGLSRPTDQAFLPDGSILVTQKTGELRVIKNGVLQTANALKLAVDTAGDRGLNAVELDPNYAQNRYIYMVYMTADPARPNQPPNNSIGRLSRFTMNAAGTAVVAGSELVLLDGIPNQTGYHMGGFLGFGADGMLYIGTGDGGATSDSINSGIQVYSQDLSRLDGKILRVNARNPQSFIPADNPYVNTPGARPEVWAIGMRNAFSGAFKPGTSDLYINDVSQDLYEEINQVIKGANYGWNQVEGPSDNPAYTDPVYWYDHSAGRSSPTGAMFYDSNIFPGTYKGKYFFGDYSQNWIQVLDTATGTVTPFATNAPSVIRMDQTADGGFYYLSYEQGRIYKISYTGTANRAPSTETAASKTSGPVGLSVTFDGAGSDDPDGDPISYLWDFGDGQTQAGISPTHVYTAAGIYQAKLIVTDNRGLSTTSLPIAITVGNNAPVVTINAPLNYVAGDIINFSGTALDPEDGVLPAGNYEWEVGFYHKGHFSDFITSLPDVTQGSFQAPTEGDTALDQFYRIKLRVTDLEGLTHETYTDVKPVIKTITLASNVPGLKVGLDLLSYAAGTGVPAVAGMSRTLTALPNQSINGVNYQFVGWSDGGAINHNIAAPSADAIYTAIYKDTTGPEAQGLSVQYYGTANFTTPGLQRIEPYIDWSVGSAAPDPSVPADQYSARWTGSVMANFSQRYTFYTQADDGVRLWINGQLIIDNWADQGVTERSATFQMVAGQKYSLRLDYYERVGGSTIRLLWSSASTPKAIIPTANLFAGVRAVSAAPTGLAAVASANGQQVSLSWADNSNNETSFKIERKGSGNADFTQIGTTGANAIGYIDTTATPGTSYTYRVRASNAVGDSIYTLITGITTPGLPAAPGAPGASASANGQQVTVTWIDNIGNETGFKVERKGLNDADFVQVFVTTANATSYVDNAVVAGATYVYRLRSTNAVGDSAYSPTATVATPTVPIAPSNLAATPASPTSIALVWADNSGNETKFVIERKGPGESAFSFLADAPANGTTYTDAGLTTGSTYAYRVRAVNAVGDSVQSNESSATPVAAPVAVEVILDNGVSNSNGAVAVTGSWATSSTFPGYYGASYLTDSNKSKGSKTVRYTPNLPMGGTYQVYAYWAAADERANNVPIDITDAYGVVTRVTVNQRVNGGQWNLLGSFTFVAGSSGANVMIRTTGTNGSVIADAVRFVRVDTGPAPVAPATPTGLAVTATTSSTASLSWDDVANESGYAIERSTGGGAWAQVGTTGAGVTTFTESGLQPATTYSYRVIALSPAGPSTPTTAVTATTLLYQGNLGTPALSGSATWTSANSLTMTAGGTDIQGTKDQGYFVGKAITGDFDVRVRIESMTAADAWTKAGLMARVSTADNARNAFVMDSPTLTRFTSRLTGGGATTSAGTGTPTYPNAWLRLVRTGNTLTGYASTDGVNWTVVGSRVFGADMPATLLVGPAATSHNPGLLTTVVFKDLSFDGVTNPDPDPTPTAPATPSNLAVTATTSASVTLGWNDVADETSYVIERRNSDNTWSQVGTTLANTTTFTASNLLPGVEHSFRVRAVNGAGPSAPTALVTATTQWYAGNLGNPAVGGSATWTGSNSLTMTAGGIDIQNKKDEGYFVGKAITGDFDVRVRIESMTAADVWTKAGLMARVSTADNARNAFVLDSPTQTRFTGRAVGGGATSNTGSGTPAYPNAWLRLVRVGNTISGYSSVDGVSWTLVGTQVSTDLPATMYVGMAATSHNPSVATTVVFKDFTG